MKNMMKRFIWKFINCILMCVSIDSVFAADNVKAGVTGY